MEPARTIITKLGGPKAIADELGIHRTRVSNWARPRTKGGTGGTVPHWRVANLLEMARKKGIELSEADFTPVMAPSPRDQERVAS